MGNLNLDFSIVVSIEPIRDEMAYCPDNIKVVSANDKLSFRHMAVEILKENRAINAVICFDPQLESTQTVAADLYALTSGRHITVDVKKRVSVEQAYTKVVGALRLNHNNLTTEKKNQILTSTGFWQSSIRDWEKVENAKLVATRLVYSPEYNNHHVTHLHIDQNTIDARCLEIEEGCATVLFDDKDFALQEDIGNGASNLEIIALQDNIVGYIPEGPCSIMIRASSPKALEGFARPCIHSQGVNGEGESTSRAMSRHDIKFL